MTLDNIIKKVSEELNIPVSIVWKTYRAYWVFIKTTIENLPLKEDLTEEDFLKLKTCFNIPSLGKLHCTYDRMCKMKSRLDYIKRLKNERVED